MNNFSQSAINGMPSVTGTWESGLVEFSGDANPENIFELFTPLNHWIQSFIKSKKGKLIIIFRLGYVNNSFSLSILDLIRQLNNCHEQGSDIEMHWYYDEEDEDIYEEGDDFKEVAKFPFFLISQ